jgi:hypothetical protein
MKFQELIPILQASISPVILMSGVGLLMLSMTNRFGRVIDRSRQLSEAIHKSSEPEKDRLAPQLVILVRRAQLLRFAITFATMSVLWAAFLIMAMFLAEFLHAEIVLLATILFMACLISIIISLIAFLQDINLSLQALKIVLRQKG